MTVEELIEELEEFTPNRDVVVWVDGENGNTGLARPITAVILHQGLEDERMIALIEIE